MTTKRRRFVKGIKLDPDTTALTEEGEVKYDDTANKLQYQDDTTSRSVVSEDGTQTLSNKTMDFTAATGNNTISADAADIDYDNTASGLTATDTQAAIDELENEIDSAATAAGTSYDNTTSGLVATDVQAAIDEVDGNLDTHIADTTTHGTTGDIVGTSDAQTLTNKTIDADSNTISNIEDADIKAAAAINATKIADGSVDNTEFQRLNGVTADIQTQLNAKLDDFTSTNDNRLVRTDGTAGEAVQESAVTLDDLGAMSGLTQLDVDNLQLDGNTIASTDVNGDINIDPNGTGDVVMTAASTAQVRVAGDHRITGTVTRDVAADNATGSNVTLTAPSTKNIRLTNASLVSIDQIPAGDNGQEIVLINATGTSVIINNDTGATAANRILTGTQALISLNDEASIPLVYDNTKARWMVSAGVGGAGAGGGLDIYYSEDAEDSTDVSSFTTGNNATFLGGGTLQGTFALNTSSVIAGTNAFRYTQAAGSLNDFVASESITLDNKQAGNDTIATLYFTYDGADDDIKFVFWDNTNSQDLSATTAFFKTASNPTRFEVQVAIPIGVTSVRWGFQVAVENIGAILDIDDIEFSTNPTPTANLVETQSLEHTFDHSALQNGNLEIRFDTGLTTNSFVGSLILEVEDDSANTRTKFNALRPCTVDVECHLFFNNDGEVPRIFKNGSTIMDGSYSDGNSGEIVTASIELDTGDFITIGSNTTVSGSSINGYITMIAKSDSENIVTPAKSSLSDWIQETPALANWTVASSEFWYKRVGNCIRYIGRLVDITPTATPTTIELPINPDTGTSYTVDSNFSTRMGVGHVYSTVVATGDLVVAVDTTTSGFLRIVGQTAFDTNQNVNNIFTANEDLWFDAMIPIEELDPNAAFLAAIPVPKVAYLKEIQTSGTEGGTFTAGSYITRTLNTVEGDSEIVSLSSNQFTLGAGTYNIEAYAPCFGIDAMKAKIRNITDASDELIGMSLQAAGDDVGTVMGRIELTTSKTFELQHRCQSTRATNGLGVATSFGDNEVYSVIKITKIK